MIFYINLNEVMKFKLSPKDICRYMHCLVDKISIIRL